MNERIGVAFKTGGTGRMYGLPSGDKFPVGSERARDQSSISITWPMKAPV